jgi:hypothetical protein
LIRTAGSQSEERKEDEEMFHRENPFLLEKMVRQKEETRVRRIFSAAKTKKRGRLGVFVISLLAMGRSRRHTIY